MKLAREQVLEIAKLAYGRGEKPDLSGRDLADLGLFQAHLPEADLSGSDLRQVVLTGADLDGADLSKSDLTEANLPQASLRGADLRHIICLTPTWTRLIFRGLACVGPFLKAQT